MPPQETDGKTRTWITRGANFVVALFGGSAGLDIGARDKDATNTYPAARRRRDHRGRELTHRGGWFTHHRPAAGPSKVTATAPGLIARIVTSKAEDLLAKAANAATYADGAPEVAPVVPWPDPADGFRLRHYPLAQYADRTASASSRACSDRRTYGEPVRALQDAARHEGALAALARGFRAGFADPRRHLGASPAPALERQPRWLAPAPDRHDEMETPCHHPGEFVRTSRDVGEGISSLYDIFVPPRSTSPRSPDSSSTRRNTRCRRRRRQGRDEGDLASWQKSA